MSSGSRVSARTRSCPMAKLLKRITDELVVVPDRMADFRRSVSVVAACSIRFQTRQPFFRPYVILSSPSSSRFRSDRFVRRSFRVRKLRFAFFRRRCAKIIIGRLLNDVSTHDRGTFRREPTQYVLEQFEEYFNRNLICELVMNKFIKKSNLHLK